MKPVVAAVACCLLLAACGPAPQAAPGPAPSQDATRALPPSPAVAAAPQSAGSPGAADAAVSAGATPQPATSQVYEVQAGDTLLAIAARYGVTAADLVAANALPDADTLAIGQQLMIPGPDAPQAAPPAPAAVDAAGAATSVDAANAANAANEEPPVKPAEPFTYHVVPGDTLLELSARYGISVADLMAANRLSSPEDLAADAALLVPIGGMSAAASGPLVHYRVQPGDTLYGLALRSGATLADLMAANHLERSDNLAAGQDLLIPGVAEDPPAANVVEASPVPAAPTALPPPTATPAPPPPAGTLEQYRAWMDEAHGVYPYAESVDTMWAVMMCESGGYAGIVGHDTYYGLFQYRAGMWSGGWNPYNANSIFDPRAQIFATAKAWLDGHQGWWRGCYPG